MIMLACGAILGCLLGMVLVGWWAIPTVDDLRLENDKLRVELLYRRVRPRKDSD